MGMIETYRPHEFAQLIGKSVSTLQRWDREGILPAHRAPTGRRYYTHDQLLAYLGKTANASGRVVAYLRVSSRSQSPDLTNQRLALETFCRTQSIHVDEWVEEIASGLNYNRAKFSKLFQDIELGLIQTLVIAHKDRLVRFGFEWFESFCIRHGTNLIVANGDTLSPEQELVQDLLSIVDVFSARLYGLRSYKKAIRDAAVQKNTFESK
jgi:predicted site-specific integrase-resolvase